MKILGIETSCDETAVAIASDADGVLCIEEHVVASQIAKHQKYGGVIPEVAARLHVPVLPKMLEEMTHWKKGDIDAVAVTTGPGLSTALRVGIETAKALASSWGVPLVPVDHIEGHIYANFIDAPVPIANEQFPILCLIVSGGHTELVLMKGHGDYAFIGQTRDDAAGEAFDKTAAQLGLSYPGGPSVSKSAIEGRKDAYDFPRPMMHSGDYDFSFSGLKTAVKNEIRSVEEGERDAQFVADISASFQEAVVDVLATKTYKAALEYGAKAVMLCGGVSANEELRQRIVHVFEDTEIEAMIPSRTYTTDNAAMIASAGLYGLRAGKVMDDLYVADADPSKVLGGPWKWEA